MTDRIIPIVEVAASGPTTIVPKVTARYGEGRHSNGPFETEYRNWV